MIEISFIYITIHIYTPHLYTCINIHTHAHLEITDKRSEMIIDEVMMIVIKYESVAGL